MYKWDLEAEIDMLRLDSVAHDKLTKTVIPAQHYKYAIVRT